MDRPSSDRYLDAEIAAGLVAAQFPDLAGQEVTELGAGWDHQLFCVGSEWIFRFPRRAERVAWLTREIEINTLVAGALGPRVPLFERIGEPARGSPTRSPATGGCRAWAPARPARPARPTRPGWPTPLTTTRPAFPSTCHG